MTNFIKQTGKNALLGAVVGGIVDILFSIFQKQSAPKLDRNVVFLADEKQMQDAKRLYFNMTDYKLYDAETEDVLMDFSKAKNPKQEMFKVMDYVF